MNQKGKVTITVTTFRRFATTLEPNRYCAIDVEMTPLVAPPPDAPPGTPADITFFQTNGTTNKNGKFLFNAPASLEITVKPREGVNATYVPLGVAFRRSTVCNRPCDLLGRGVLQASVAPKTNIITIRNAFDHPHTTPDPVVYEFYILIQREADGALGVIDPDIENKEN